MKRKLFLLLVAVLAVACVFASCGLVTYSVTFDAQNGTDPVVVEFTSEFAMPESPTNGDKEFGGWYTDAACTAGNEWTVPEKLTADITVYARWLKPKACVIFDAQNGNEPEKLKFEGLVVPTPSNGRKDFGGWYTDPDCTKGNEWTVPDGLTEDITVYAKWIDVYFVTFDAQNGSAPQEVKFTSEFALPEAPAQEGKVFLGWYTDSDCTDGNLWTAPKKLTEDVTVYGRWGDKYYVTFECNIGEAPIVVLFEYGMEMPVPYNGLKTFGGWFTDEGCTKGNEWTVPGELTANITVYAKWKAHVHDYGDNYMMFVECSNPQCYNIGRKNTTNSAKANFIYNFDDAARTRIDDLYQAVLDAIASGEMVYDDFEKMFLNYDDEVSYIVEQYQYAYVFYKTYTDEEYKTNFDTISEYYNENVSRYYGLYRKVYESSYKDSFFEGWTEEEIAEALALSDSYGSEDYKAIKDEIDALLLEYDEMMDNEEMTANDFSLKYGEFVALNNSLAVQLGYENYMEYAYAVKYERDYSPADVAVMRNFVKTYMVPVTDKIYERYEKISFTSADTNYSFYDSLTGASVFKTTTGSKLAVGYMANYFKDMYSNDYDEEIDFFYHANELFKNGNYYTGQEDGAFSYWIPNQQTSILYFGNTLRNGRYSYQDSFTFVHEFGHYYNNIYNKGLSLCMDHDETQSQGDEMMFLAWLATHCAGNEKYGYEAVSTIQMVNMMYIICLATAVDEFEQAAYTGSYNGNALPVIPGSEDVDYARLFGKIISSYSSLVSDQNDYWYNVAFHSAGYYISYAMSALPCVELYVNAMGDFNNAKDMYFKLFTFSDNPKFVTTDENGSRSVKATYAEILNYAGLKSPFQEELYTIISRYYR